MAAHLAEFGYRTAWASRLGQDPFGDRIMEGLAGQGVDVSLVRRDSTAPTGVYFKDPDLGHGARTLYYRAGSAASAMVPDDSAAWPLEETGWIHTSGINAALSAGCNALTEHLLTHARATGYKVSFDVNYRPALWDVDAAGPRLLELAAGATVVLVGLDEAETLWGCTTAEQVAALLPGPRQPGRRRRTRGRRRRLRSRIPGRPSPRRQPRGQARPGTLLCRLDAGHTCGFPPWPRNQTPHLRYRAAVN